MATRKRRISARRSGTQKRKAAASASARKVADALACLRRQLADNKRELKEAHEQQAATTEILRVISSSPTDVQPVFEAILENATRLCGAHLAALGLYDGERYEYVAQRGGKPEFIERLFRGPIIPLEGTNLWRMIYEQRPLHIPDLVHNPQVRSPSPVFLDHGARTVLTVPMLKEGRVVGGIHIYRPEVHPFTQEQIDLVKTFASQAVIAIENVRLFNETKEALERQTATAEILKVIASSPSDVQPVFDAIVETAKRLLGGFSASVARIVDGMVHLAAFTGIGESGERALKSLFPAPLSERYHFARVVEAKAPFCVGDAETNPDVTAEWREMARQRGFRSVLFVPMLREGVAIGTINVTRREPGAFSDHQINLLKTFADQAVIAIENVRLFKELQARNADVTEALEQQTATAEVLRVISSSPTDIQRVFDAILENATRLCGGHLGLLGLYDGETYQAVAQRGANAEFAKWLIGRGPFKPGSSGGVLTRMIAERRPIHIPDHRESPAYRDRKPNTVAFVDIGGARTYLAVPMLKEGRVVGGITIYRPEVRSFTQKQIDLLSTFASQAVIAIENVRLFNEIQDKSRQLEIANKHKSDFLAHMSHELRTPLNAIIGFSEALIARMFGEVNAKQDEYLNDIHSSGQHLLLLINDILDLAKVEAGRMELELSDFDLPSALQNAMTLIRERAQAHGIALELRVDGKLGQIRADERKFKQIVLNLLSNAVKFTPDGGRVEVDAHLNDAAVEVSVKDTGAGIGPEDQAALFEEFRQVGRNYANKQEGTGLGLALTRRFVELHGGKIWLESATGKGSTFTFTLPLSGKMPPPMNADERR